MIFRNRSEAGKKLATALTDYLEKSDTVVVALARGGVSVGYEVANALKLPLEVICPRKIGAPFNEEFAIGAVTEEGDPLLSTDVIRRLGVSEEYLAREIEKQRELAKKRALSYRKGRKAISVKEKKVLLVDDGIATGASIRAAARGLKKAGAQSIIIAVPVAAMESAAKLQKEVDEVIVLHAPPDFYAVGQFYEQFGQVTDEEVIDLLNKKQLV